MCGCLVGRKARPAGSALGGVATFTGRRKCKTRSLACGEVLATSEREASQHRFGVRPCFHVRIGTEAGIHLQKVVGRVRAKDGPLNLHGSPPPAQAGTCRRLRGLKTRLGAPTVMPSPGKAEMERIDGLPTSPQRMSTPVGDNHSTASPQEIEEAVWVHGSRTMSVLRKPIVR